MECVISPLHISLSLCHVLPPGITFFSFSYVLLWLCYIHHVSTIPLHRHMHEPKTNICAIQRPLCPAHHKDNHEILPLSTKVMHACMHKRHEPLASDLSKYFSPMHFFTPAGLNHMRTVVLTALAHPSSLPAWTAAGVCPVLNQRATYVVSQVQPLWPALEEAGVRGGERGGEGAELSWATCGLETHSASLSGLGLCVNMLYSFL